MLRNETLTIDRVHTIRALENTKKYTLDGTENSFPHQAVRKLHVVQCGIKHIINADSMQDVVVVRVHTAVDMYGCMERV